MNLKDLRAVSDAIIDNVRQSNENKNKKVKVEREVDDRFWKVTIDDNVEGSATIRFLPPPRPEKDPKIEYWEYNFKHERDGKTYWYIAPSLNSLHQYHPELKAQGVWDPMGEYNSKLYKSGPEGQKQASAQKRSHRMVTNILVVDDPAHPENNGKVFLFKCGPQIWNKVEFLMFPPKGSKEKPLNPLNFWEGFDFNIIVKPNGDIVPGKKKPFPNYNDSYFSRSPSPIADSDEAIAAIYSKVYPLMPFVDPATYPSREDLQKRIDKIFGLSEAGTQGKPTEITKQQLELENQMSNTEEPPFDIDDNYTDAGDIDIDSILASIQDK